MKQFLINLFKIEQYFYVHYLGFNKETTPKVTHRDTSFIIDGKINIKSLKSHLCNKYGYDNVIISNIISISKKQYNELNK